MKQPVTTITQSKYYSPIFNAAIFDGPVRLYFSQPQESYALGIYFKIRQQLKEKNDLKTVAGGPNIFIMIYPDRESFELTFAEESKDSTLICHEWGEDQVVGVNSQVDDKESQQDQVSFRVSQILSEDLFLPAETRVVATL